MPYPKEFSNERDWMDACMHQCVTVEKKEQKPSVAICLNRWRKGKKSARRVIASFLEAFDKESGVWIDPKRTPRLKERLRERTKSYPSPSIERTEPKPKENDEKEFFENGKWVMRKFEHGKWTEIKEPVHG